jgi:hypothetical protein
VAVREKVSGKVKYRVCYHQVVLFVTKNTLQPNGLVNALFIYHHTRLDPSLAISSNLPPHELGLGYRRRKALNQIHP